VEKGRCKKMVENISDREHTRREVYENLKAYMEKFEIDHIDAVLKNDTGLLEAYEYPVVNVHFI